MRLKMSRKSARFPQIFEKMQCLKSNFFNFYFNIFQKLLLLLKHPNSEMEFYGITAYLPKACQSRRRELWCLAKKRGKGIELTGPRSEQMREERVQAVEGGREGEGEGEGERE